jgi:hypothetical protein
MWLVVLCGCIALLSTIGWVLTLLGSGFSSAQSSMSRDFDTTRKIYKHDPVQYVKEEFRDSLTQADLDRIRDASKWRLDW